MSNAAGVRHIANNVDGYIAKYGDDVIGRMVADGARNTSDDEINRTLSPCVCGPMLIAIAHEMRSRGILDLTKFDA